MSAPHQIQHRAIWQYVVVAGVVLLVVGGLAWGLATLAAQSERNARLERDVSILAEQVRGLGGTPAVTPQPGPTGERGQAGATGAPGRPPTQAEIAAAVAAYLRANPPPRGRPPTMAELLTAVTGYLRENPPAAGPSGPPGAAGRDGVDGQDGADGPPPTDEQIRAAVEEYLTSHPLNCPTGFHLEERTVITDSGPESAAVCVRDQEGP